MSEYIDRKAVAPAIDEQLELSKGDWLFVDRAIANIPPADVAPVVHGEWLLRHIGAGHYWECSVCHTNPCIYVTEHTKFCPNCGAKMD